MQPWFNWRRQAPDPQALGPQESGPMTDEDRSTAEREADRARLERDVAAQEAASRKAAEPSWRDAYDRGRRDERARRPGFSLVSAVVLLAAIVGGGAIVLAAREGSFTRGGEVVDHQLTTVAHKAQAPLRGTADRAGDALENAGHSLKDKAGDGRQQADNDRTPRP